MFEYVSIMGHYFTCYLASRLSILSAFQVMHVIYFYENIQIQNVVKYTETID